MIYEHSYGIIPLKKQKTAWYLLLVQLHAGHWGFPKGHIEKGEEVQQAATRELFEETGLRIKHFLTDETLSEKYFFTHQGKLIEKTVTYFVAEVTGRLKIQKDEVKAAKWVPLDQADQFITFSAGKAICDQVRALLR